MDTASEFQKKRVDDFFQERFRERADEMMATSAVLELVRAGTISSGKRAELLGLDRATFSRLLTKRQIPSFELLPGESIDQHLAEGMKVLDAFRHGE